MTSFRFILLMLSVGCLALPSTAFAADSDINVNGESAVAFIQSCRKPNGAFGPIDQEYTDAAWNYPAVHSLRLLNADIPNPDQILANGLGYPKGHAGYGHWLVYHQAMTCWLLESDEQVFGSEVNSKRVRLTHQGYEIRYYVSPFGTDGDHFFKTDGESTSRQFRQSTELGFYNLSSLFYLVAAITADGRQIANPDQLVKFILDRQAPNGGFVDLRVPKGEPQDSETHIAHISRRRFTEAVESEIHSQGRTLRSLRASLSGLEEWERGHRDGRVSIRPGSHARGKLCGCLLHLGCAAVTPSARCQTGERSGVSELAAQSAES